MTSKPAIFKVSNKHAASSGNAPRVDGNEPGKYHGYFENEYGEQAIFVYDRETRTGTLWMGDAGWEGPIEVTRGAVEELMLSEVEALWLGACWLAATSRESTEEN